MCITTSASPRVPQQVQHHVHHHKCITTSTTTSASPRASQQVQHHVRHSRRIIEVMHLEPKVVLASGHMNEPGRFNPMAPLALPSRGPYAIMSICV
eukprot:CAMPEP_0202343916 /NCGR_PEP_ID=MMETSP1126-20121109/3825_1 /ASSEMBLY_ACC=CAM_ASM_000457 /TAXON_ID=3047 /ORGANISM="Dunaliella tertiolecta, Strain CCMP1320" /LENGTH=95 /DNA_ID=CAMNT_0048935039 /DNA_START=476 /DNA_END=763 /DNA_ORIENTATION=+